MNRKQERHYEMFGRLDRFGNERKDKFPEGSEGARTFGVIAAVLAQINGMTGDKRTKRRDTKATRVTTRQALVARVVAIARTARVLAKTVPDADARFPLPERQSDTDILQTGLLFVREAAAVKDNFIQCGLEPTFYEELQKEVAAFQQAIAERSKARTGSVVSRQAIVAAIKAGLDAAQSLDTLVANTLGRDVQAMNEWKRVRHTVRIGGTGAASASTEAEPAPVPPAAEPATTNAAEEPLRRAS